MGEASLLTQLAEAILETLRPRLDETWDTRRERVRRVLELWKVSCQPPV